MKKSTPVLWLLLSSVLLITQSCIDNKYSLDNLPDKLLVAGDSIVLPLGTADKLSMKQFLKDQDFTDLKEKADGTFYISKCDSTKINLPNNDISISLGTYSFNQSLSSYVATTSGPKTVTIPSNSAAINISGRNTSSIERTDSLIFTTSSSLNLEFSLSNMSTSGNASSVTLSLVIPNELSVAVVNEGSLTYDSGLQKYIYSVTKPVNGATNTVILKLNKLVGNSNQLNFAYHTTFSVPSGSTINVGSNPSFNLKLTPNAGIRRFFGKLIINPDDSKYNVELPKVDISNIYNLFENSSDMISLYNPVLYLDTKTTFGIPLSATLSLNGDTPASSTPVSTTLAIAAPTVPAGIKHNAFALYSKEDPKNPGYSNAVQFDIRNLLKGKPNNITTKVKYGATGDNHFISIKDSGIVKYNLEIPLAFASDFMLSYADTLEDVFEDEINDVLFSTGEVELKGTVVSTIPLNATLKIKILTENNELIEVENKGDITFNKANPTQSESPVSIILSSTILKGKKAKDLIAEFTLKSASDIEGIAIKSTDYVFMKDIRIVKRGGFSLDLK